MTTLPHSLTAEAVKKLHVSIHDDGENAFIFSLIQQGFGNDSGGGNHDDDDAESVTSECSTFSISSEVSVSPYVKYPHPVTVSLLPYKCSLRGRPLVRPLPYMD